MTRTVRCSLCRAGMLSRRMDTYTCGVKNPGAKIKCFLLRATSYTPVLTPFSPLA